MHYNCSFYSDGLQSGPYEMKTDDFRLRRFRLSMIRLRRVRLRRLVLEFGHEDGFQRWVFASSSVCRSRTSAGNILNLGLGFRNRHPKSFFFLVTSYFKYESSAKKWFCVGLLHFWVFFVGHFHGYFGHIVGYSNGYCCHIVGSLPGWLVFTSWVASRAPAVIFSHLIYYLTYILNLSAFDEYVQGSLASLMVVVTPAVLIWSLESSQL